MPPCCERLGHHLADGGEQLGDLAAVVSVSVGRAPVQPRPPQRLVGVDVADPADQGLVEQRPLDPGAPAAQRGGERGVVERRVQRVAGDVRDRRGGTARRRPTRSVSMHGPNVRWSTKRSSGPPSAKREPDPQVLLVRRVRRTTSSWPLMPRWASSACRRRRSGQPQVLAAALGPTATVRPGQPGRRSPSAPGRCRRIARGCRTSTAAIVAADDPALQAPPDDLDLGQLGHRPRPRRRRHFGRRAPARRLAAGPRRSSRRARIASRPPRRPAARPPSCCGPCPSP